MITDYEIIIHATTEDNLIDYEEITVEDFFERECATEDDYIKFKNKYSATNIHMMICQESYENTKQLFKDVNTDPRLKDLNAIVMLSLKRRGRGKSFTPLTQVQFNELVVIAMDNEHPFGMDSCTGPKFLKAIQGHKNYEAIKQTCEPCESGLFSTFINHKGIFFPCSFAEGFGDWKEGIDVVNCKDFLEDVWFHPKVNKWKQELINTKDENDCRNCLLFEV